MEIDPRVVLSYLNQLGYRNITALQLKEFMKDLHKLIKYEAQIAKCERPNRNFVQECVHSLTAGAKKDANVQIPEYPSDSSKENQQKVTKNAEKPIEKKSSPKRVSRGVSTDHIKVKEIDENKKSQPTPEPPPINKENISRPCSRTSSKATYDVKTDNEERCKMWIRTTRPKPMNHKNDPVELYHKYAREWERHKQHIPGENDHSELRWRIRTKLLS
ncbi:uncharacterized protein LOC134831617 [Culicoides brevitarsis]|uniref:uncharacterized protein LOC134831617 n=1 Tax=Culicoides brevitarsis TaxID=469753 RepID=UPI00307B3DC3